MLKNKKLSLVFLACSLILPVVIFAFTAWYSYGWDDEIFSINNVEQNDSFTNLINTINSTDVHPVGMYVISLLFYKIFNNWSIVRMIGALIVACSLWLYWFSTRNKDDYSANFLSYVFLCLNPSVLLWCSGLRWYTWILPLVCFLALLINRCNNKFSAKDAIKFWACYFILCVLMFHVSYFAAIIILSSFVTICYERRKFLLSELKIIISFGIISLILISYQTFYFLTVHYPSGKDVMGESLTKCIAYAGQYFLTGATLVPVSISGIMAAIAGTIILISFLWNIKTLIRDCSNKIFLLSCFINILTKIAISARYYIIFIPLHSKIITDSFVCIKHKSLKILIIVLYCLSNIGGVYSVMSHKNTVKASWDTPYTEIINNILSIDTERKMTVVTSNTVLEYWLKKYDFKVVNPIYDDISFGNLNRPLIIVQTFKGTLSLERYQEQFDYIENHNIKFNVEIGHDDFAWFKRKFDNGYPDYYAKIVVIE